ncbi:receptor-type tyrosine-protein phosphatase beta-like [Mercenaria mercenaria]|uniref:receptor-type tyrosine-protein phosphatase beta-like n=1 Tax=Mercenaria mercenaria TaxID=6596 RepID=UPI00234E669B|nr:receptor-type tyrosine-protein phosphatase beta-like [Mercenaria mercenaria]
MDIAVAIVNDINKIGQRISDTSSTEASRLESNTPKNRWVNILPFDHSRVKLQQIDDDDPTSDYINANYMPGFNNQREYIATQGPLPGTIDDFWRMVWENGVMVIVMLTQCKEGNRVKCEKYWPDELREPKQYGEVVVNPISISTLDKYNISIFDVSVDGQSRQVIHFHYLDFPDFSANVEFDHFITFVRNVRSHVPHDNTGPIIVHCSAGVGRTGTFIATDRLSLYLDSPEFSENDDVDIFGMVVGMRENRIAMVQTESQYIMIHDCFDKMLEEKRKALQATDSTEDLYENQGFVDHQLLCSYESRPGSHPFPEVLYENVTTSPQQVQLQEQEEEKQQQQTEL